MAIAPSHPLRIAQVVSYVSRDGAFGGPVAVALAQSRALAALGHTVQLYAGWDGQGRLMVPGVRVSLHRAFRGRLPLVAVLPPGLPLALRSRLRSLDVVHLHFGRDLVSLLAVIALRGYRGKIVLQPHGMVMPDSRPIARLIDALLVRPALSRADAVLALTDAEERGLRTVSRGQARIMPIRNGIETAAGAMTKRTRPPVVLFLARLHPRKNAPLFVEAALQLLGEGIAADFVVAGPDEGDLAQVRRPIGAAGRPGVSLTTTRCRRPKRRTVESRVAFVLPSVGEVPPITVLEALAAGTPSIVSLANGPTLELESWVQLWSCRRPSRPASGRSAHWSTTRVNAPLSPIGGWPPFERDSPASPWVSGSWRNHLSHMPNGRRLRPRG